MKKESRSTIHVKYKAKVAKTMFFVVVAFLICHMPFTAQIIYRNHLLQQNEMSNNVQNSVNKRHPLILIHYGDPILDRSENRMQCACVQNVLKVEPRSIRLDSIFRTVENIVLSQLWRLWYIRRRRILAHNL